MLWVHRDLNDLLLVFIVCVMRIELLWNVFEFFFQVEFLFIWVIKLLCGVSVAYLFYQRSLIRQRVGPDQILIHLFVQRVIVRGDLEVQVVLVDLERVYRPHHRLMLVFRGVLVVRHDHFHPFLLFAVWL